jgi:hypothetical protein
LDLPLRCVEQIDFLLVSGSLKDRLVGAGVVRRGMYDLEGLTTAAGRTIDIKKQYHTVPHWQCGLRSWWGRAEFNIR